jgi:hypothetical protein
VYGMALLLNIQHLVCSCNIITSVIEAVVKRIDVHLDNIVIKYPELSLVWTDQGTVKNWLSLFSVMQCNCMLCYESVAGLVVNVNSHNLTCIITSTCTNVAFNWCDMGITEYFHFFKVFLVVICLLIAVL